MNESDLLEKQLRSWIPRRASAKVSARLFSQAGQAAMPVASHSEVVRWLAPVAVCFLTMLAITGGNVRRSPSLPEAGSASSFAIVMMDAAHSSNISQQVFSLSKMNVNLEWNVWPQVSFRPENPARSSFWSAMTNK